MHSKPLQDPVQIAISTVQTCVVYDKKTGEIVHTHASMALKGASQSTPEEVEAEAYDLACRITGRRHSELGVMFIKREELNPALEYKVDVAKSCLVEKKGRKV